MKTKAWMAALLSGSAAAFLLSCGSAGAQVLKGSATERPGKEWGAKNRAPESNKLIQSALAQSVRVSPTGAPGGFADGSNSAIIAVMRRQSARARALIGLLRPAGARGGAGGSTQGGTLLKGGATGAPAGGGPAASQPGMLLKPGSTPALNGPGGSVPQIGAERTMSSSGTGTTTTSPGQPANPLTPASGPSKHQSPGGQHPAVRLGARAPMPTQLCKAGIGTVDGARNGVWFSPVSGPDGQFVIEGCGFGNAPGEVYLSGVQYDSSRSRMGVQPAVFPLCPGCVSFRIQPNGWSDRQIVADVDRNASGFYDTNNVTLVVKTASGQIYQAPGMNFLAAREDQVLSGILTAPAVSGIHLVKVTDSEGEVISPYAASPSVWGNAGKITISVERERAMNAVPSPAYTFPGGKDTYQFHFAPGFQLDPHVLIDLWHGSVDARYCRSVGGVYASTGPGSWSVNYLSTSSFEVRWGEESCWPPPPLNPHDPRNAPRAGNPQYMLNFASVSGYGLRITVLGPRGVSPWANGNLNSMGIKRMQNVAPLLKKQ